MTTAIKKTTEVVPPASDYRPTGLIQMFGGAVAPTGWKLCNGDALGRTTYSALFATIGTAFGVGDGSTTFNVPNMQGVGVTGAGSNTDFNGTGRTKGGASLGDYDEDVFQNHYTASLGGNFVTGADNNYTPGTGTKFTGNGYNTTTGAPVSDTVSAVRLSTGVNAETRISSVVVNFIIAI